MTIVVPAPDLFTHRSHVHGQRHVARVMIHAMRLIDATGTEHLRTQLWAAVFLHDLARTHDGECHRHGADAVARWKHEPALATMLGERQIHFDAEPGVQLAVRLHCMPKRHEPPRDSPDWPLVALLKDADALDRVRLGDLDPSYLRWPQARKMIDFAQQLHDDTHWTIPEGPDLFEQLRNSYTGRG